MGWDFTRKPSNVKAYMAQNATYAGDGYAQRVLDSAIVKMTEYYAAVERVHSDGTREIWCHVAMLQFTRDADYNFGKKDMCDTMGPNIANCPARILDLLTPTTNENANAWRAICRKRAAMAIKIGDRIKLTRPLKFVNGAELDTFTVERVGRRRRGFRGTDGQLYQIRGLKEIGYTAA